MYFNQVFFTVDLKRCTVCVISGGGWVLLSDGESEAGREGAAAGETRAEEAGQRQTRSPAAAGDASSGSGKASH